MENKKTEILKEALRISYMEGYVAALNSIKECMKRAGIKEVVFNDEAIDFMIEKALQSSTNG